MKKRKILIVLALLLGGWASAQNISPEDYDDGLLNENGITSGFGNGNFNSSGLISSDPDLTGGGPDFSSSGLLSRHPDIFGGGTDFSSTGLISSNPDLFGGGTDFSSTGLISSNPDIFGMGSNFSSTGLISSNPDLFGGGTDFNSSGLFGVNFGGGFESDDYGDGQLPLGSGIALLAALACGYAGIKRNNKHSNDI